MTDPAVVPQPGDPHARPADLCQPCQEARTRWLDYRMPRTLGIAYGSGAPYDTTPAGIRDRQRATFERWRDTIRFNRDLIARTCREQRHTETPPEPKPAVVVLPLFDLVEQRKAA